MSWDNYGRIVQPNWEVMHLEGIERTVKEQARLMREQVELAEHARREETVRADRAERREHVAVRVSIASLAVAVLSLGVAVVALAVS